MASLQIQLVWWTLLSQHAGQLPRVLRLHIEPRHLVVVIDSKSDDGPDDQTVDNSQTSLVYEGDSPRKTRR